MQARSVLRPATAAAVLVTGCTALIDVGDVFFDPNAPSPGRDASTSADGALLDGQAGADGSTPCEAANLQTDGKHCGRCNHDCLGGECAAGICQPVQIASLPTSPLRDVLVTTDYVFVSTGISLVDELGGIWRIPRAGGAAQHFVTTQYAETSVAVDGSLYFIVNDYAADGGSEAFGGLWKCPVAAAAPCTPELVAAAESPRSIATDNGRIYYPDGNAGLIVFNPATPPATLFRDGYSATGNLAVRGEDAFYTVTFFQASPEYAAALHILPDAGLGEITRYENTNAEDGDLEVTPNAFFFTAYDSAVTTGGVVRRVPRAGSGVLPCDFAPATLKRPYGLHVDATRVFWSNQGIGPLDEPWTGGSVVACDVTTCCTQTDVLWSGDGRPMGLGGDDRGIYWVTNDKGGVWALAKP